MSSRATEASEKRSNSVRLKTIRVSKVVCLSLLFFLCPAAAVVHADGFGVAGRTSIPQFDRAGFQKLMAGAENETYVLGVSPYLAKLDGEGRQEMDFGQGGYVSIGPIVPGVPGQPQGNDATRDADGNIVVVGIYKARRPFLTRILPDGRLDKTFGRNGTVLNRRSGSGLGRILDLYLVSVDPAGRIVAAGLDVRRRPIVVRYKRNGNLDKTFANGGFLTLAKHRYPFVQGVQAQRNRSLLLVSTGKAEHIIAVSNSGRRLKGYNQRKGIRRIAGNPRSPGQLLPGPGGRLFVAQTIDGPESRSTLIQITGLKPNGRLDRSFGNRGAKRVRSSDLPAIFPSFRGPSRSISDIAFAVQSDGKLIVTAGMLGGGATGTSTSFRLDGTGEPDLTFGAGGLHQTGSYPGPMVAVRFGHGALVGGGQLLDSAEPQRPYIYGLP